MKVFNTLSARKVEFLPEDNEVKMYVCGITPYESSHLGHAMSYVIFDVVRRYLQYKGYKVKYVQNITDIDDKIIDRANRLGISTTELTERYIKGFFEDMEALNVAPATVYPRATQEVPKILEVIKGLVEKGFAYPAGGSVYFRVRRDPDYGKLSHRTLEGSMEAGGRIEVGEEKEHPMDFALWKAAKPGEPSWESPWGPGRPGWHIECSAMALKYLGDTLDIHGGGQDLIFPHHENEIAQSESFTGRPFARYWMHNGLLQFGEEKMSKSLGNLVPIREALERYSPDAVRIFIISSHYRSPLTYSDEALEAAERGAGRLSQAARGEGRGSKIASLDIESFRDRFTEAMDDDFNTAQALAALFDLARDINRLRDEGHDVIAAQRLLEELAGVLGLTLKPEEKPLPGDAAPFIELLITIRAELRKARQWEPADRIRAGLAGLGVTLEDTPTGTIWKRKRLGSGGQHEG